MKGGVRLRGDGRVARSRLDQEIATGLLSSTFLDQPGIEEGSDDVHRSLAGDFQVLPDFCGGEAPMIEQQAQQVFLSGRKSDLRRSGTPKFLQPQPDAIKCFPQPSR